MPSGDKDKTDEPFTFVDKRRRSEEEEVRPEARPSGAGEETKAQKAEDEEELKAPPIDFSTFVLSLASNAVYSMGGFQDPVSGKTSVNLAQAKQAIDIISMIEEKTRGNLTEEESNLIGHVLYDLRLKFVETSRR